MDIATILGLLLAFGLVLASILVGGPISAFIDVPSLLIVGGGTLGVCLINYPLKRVLGAMGIAMNAFRFAIPDVGEQNAKMLEFAEVTRKEGILALESALGGIDDEFMKKGLQLLVDGVEAEKIENMLWDELDAVSARHRLGAKIFESLAAYAPAMGLVGTLIGLVQMLQNMDDPANIGPAMAVALLTTFYGALFANAVFQPIAGKLKTRHDEELLVKQLVIKGLMGISRGENPRLLSQQLEAELAPADRTGGEG